MVTTDRADYAESCGRFRNHGISTDARQRQARVRRKWHYEMVLLGQLTGFTRYRMRPGPVAAKEAEKNLLRSARDCCLDMTVALCDLKAITLPTRTTGVNPAWHLYSHRLNLERLSADEARIFAVACGEHRRQTFTTFQFTSIPTIAIALEIGQAEYPHRGGCYARPDQPADVHAMSDGDVEMWPVPFRK